MAQATLGRSVAMRRFLHILPEAPQLAGRNIIQAAPPVDPRVPQTPNFKVLSLGSLLQAHLPPSIELFAKRNTLAGILGNDALSASVSSRLQMARSPLLSLWGRQPVLQQKVVGTSPLTCLIASKRHEYLSAVELDGSTDWIVKSPVLAFTGRQLHLSPRSGWRPGSPPFAHTTVSGRGWLCFGSPSSTVQINVPQGESVLVAKPHLSAFTIDSNAAFQTPALRDLKIEFERLQPSNINIEHTEVGVAPSPSVQYWHKTVNTVKKLTSHLYRYLRSGNTNSFVEIYGPSTVIVSSASNPPRVTDTKPEQTT